MAYIDGKLIKTEISTDDGTTWKELVCEQTSGFDFTRETTTAPVTKCDSSTSPTELALGSYSARFSFDALTTTTPTVNQLTYADMLTLAVNGTTIMLRRQYDNTGSDFYITGDAMLLALSDAAPADGFHSFTGEFGYTGALDITV